MPQHADTGMNKSAAEWARVVPGAVVRGSLAQSSNVLAMAIEDIRRQEIRIERLRDALEPFVFGDAAVEAILYKGMSDNESGTITVKLGDFRRARAALAVASPQEGGGT